MATKDFKKENVRTEIRDGNNRVIGFIPVFGGDGVLSLDEDKDKETIAALEKLADQRIGGVVRISAEIFDSLKKNEVLMPSRRPSSFNQMRVSPSPESFVPKVGAPPAVANPGITIMEDLPPPSSIGAFKARSRPITPGKPAT